MSRSEENGLKLGEGNFAAKYKTRKFIFTKSARILVLLLIVPGLPQAMVVSCNYHGDWKSTVPHSRNPAILVYPTKPIFVAPAEPFLSLSRSAISSKNNSDDDKREMIKKMMLTKCPGRKNLVNDIGIFSLIVGVLSSTLGIYSLIYNSITSSNLGIISGLGGLAIWVPSAIIGALSKEGSFYHHISNWLNGSSFFNDMLGFIGIWYGTLDVITSWWGEVVGFIGMGLSIIATFPDFLDGLIEFAYSVGNRKKLEYMVDNYGCDVPSVFTFMGEHLHDILDRLLINSTKRVTAYVKNKKV